VANALVAGTVYTSAQPNITSVGTLTILNTSGNVSATGNITAAYYFGNGSQLTGVSGSGSNSFATMDANGTSIVATSGTDTLTFVAGTNVTILGNATAKSITIASTASGGSGDILNPFLLMGG
jgi:hypothetical protein